MPINAGKIESILQNFVSGTGDIQGATLVSPDDLSLASVLPRAMDDEKVSAMSAAMLSLGERIGSELLILSLNFIYNKMRKIKLVHFSIQANLSNKAIQYI